MRQPASVTKPVVLTIAGSDSGGGAGIQADLKTMEAWGAFGTSVITSVTAQNTQGVDASFVLPTEEIEKQLHAVRSDFDIAAIKTGLLATADIIDVVTDHAQSFDCPLIVDPVMVAATGDRLLDETAVDAYEDLIAAATLITPNTDEAAALTRIDPSTEREAHEAAEQLLDMGCEGALVTGGHILSEDVLDVLHTSESVETYTHPRIETEATHGSGCTLSSAITARLAHETDEPMDSQLRDAVEDATGFMERAIRYHHDVGTGPGAVHHLVALRERANRQPVQESIERLVRDFVRQNVRPIVPEVGMNIVGSTVYAEATDEIAAVEGRITKTVDGVHPNRGVRFGASSHMARFLLSLREHDPSIHFAVNCRFDDDIEAALDSLGWTIGEYDRSEEPTPGAENTTMGWGAKRAFESVEGTPVAVVDRGSLGKEPITKLLATDRQTLYDRTIALLDACTTE